MCQKTKLFLLVCYEITEAGTGHTLCQSCSLLDFTHVSRNLKLNGYPTFLDMWWVILRSIQSLGPECLASKSLSLVKDLRKRLLCWGQMPRIEISERNKSGAGCLGGSVG